MDNQTMIKHSSTVFGLIMGIIIVIGIFTGMFYYLQQNAIEADIPIDSEYNQTYTRLQNISNQIDTNVNDIQNNLNKVQEAESSVQQAWNGLKGLGSVLKLPISFISVASQTWDAITVNLDIVPIWVKVLIGGAIIVFGVLLILSVLKGDSNLIR